jgi:hypothetical protein
LSEIEWLGAGAGFVVEIVTVILQKRREVWVILSSVKREQGLAGGRYVHFPPRLVMRQAFTGRAVVSAEPGVGSDGCAIDVKREDICGHRAFGFVAGVSVNAV